MYYKVITIGRQFGSGGSEVGEIVARKLGIDYYNDELIMMAAKNSNISTDILKEVDEKKPTSLLFSLFEKSNEKTNLIFPPNDVLFTLQSEVIRALAEERRCVIVGRCADYVLRGRNDVLSVFVHSDTECRINRIMTKRNLDRKEASALISRVDKNRSCYYNYYTNKKWGNKESYGMMLNSGKIGVHTCAEFIAAALLGNLSY